MPTQTPRLTALCTLLTLSLTACASRNLYELPAPPPEAERTEVSLVPGEDARNREREYIQARAAILRLYQLLSAKRYKESLELMSQETRDMLAFVSPTNERDAASTLIEGRMQFRDGQQRSFDPVTTLLADDITSLTDTVEGVEEQETSRRKEIFAEQGEGKDPQRIVMIKEGGKWVLHRTSVDTKESR
ncbi:MAG: hypothetical protein AAGI01_05370 [Myxococcota bacterium]